jgi:hypothetical protein
MNNKGLILKPFPRNTFICNSFFTCLSPYLCFSPRRYCDISFCSTAAWLARGTAKAGGTIGYYDIKRGKISVMKLVIILAAK